MATPGDTGVGGGKAVVLAIWHTRPDTPELVAKHIPELRARSLEEDGCLAYDVYRGEGASHFVLVEVYRDADAVEAHRASSHFRDLVLERIAPLLASRSVMRLQPMPE